MGIQKFNNTDVIYFFDTSDLDCRIYVGKFVDYKYKNVKVRFKTTPVRVTAVAYVEDWSEYLLDKPLEMLVSNRTCYRSLDEALRVREEIYAVDYAKYRKFVDAEKASMPNLEGIFQYVYSKMFPNIDEYSKAAYIERVKEVVGIDLTDFVNKYDEDYDDYDDDDWDD